MAYAFSDSDRSVEAAFRRIAREQIEKAIAAIDGGQQSDAETVHEARKRCKKLRGLIRLVRPAFGDYRAENAFFRDAARGLSGLRDSDVLVTTFDKLTAGHKGADDLAAVRERLAARRDSVISESAPAERDAAAQLTIFRKDMAAALHRVDKWALSAKGFAALAGGLEATYRRGRAAGRMAHGDPTPEKLHEWRKRVKYHGYHASLLAPVWPELLGAYCAEAERLGELLGDHNDLSVFADLLTRELDVSGDRRVLKRLLRMAKARQEILQAEAFGVGARLFAERPDALVARWRGWWKASRKEGKRARRGRRAKKAA